MASIPKTVPPPWKNWYLGREEAFDAGNARRLSSGIQRCLSHQNSVKVRSIIKEHYRSVYGPDHHFVKSLDDLFTNYYRIDSGSAQQIANAQPGRPLIVFLMPFVDKVDPSTGRKTDAASQFADYYGADVDTFLELVRTGRLLPTIGRMKAYEHPFMLDVLQRLHALEETHRPVYANAAQDALERAGPGRETAALDKLALLSRRHPGFLERERQVVIDGKPSALPPETTRLWLEKRLRSLGPCLPAPFWRVLDTLMSDLLDEPSEARLQQVMDAVFVFLYLFFSPIHYSRGPSIRVSSRDVAHWVSVLGSLDALMEQRKRGYQELQENVEAVQEALDNLGMLREAYASRVPVLSLAVRPTERYVMPRILHRGDLDALRGLGRRLEGDPGLSVQARSRGETQKLFVARYGQVAIPAGNQMAVDAEESILNLARTVHEVGFAKASLARATVKAGGTVPSWFVPYGEDVLDAADRTLGVVQKWRESRVDHTVRKEMNLDFQIGLDLFQVEGSP